MSDRPPGHCVPHTPSMARGDLFGNVPCGKCWAMICMIEWACSIIEAKTRRKQKRRSRRRG